MINLLSVLDRSLHSLSDTTHQDWHIAQAFSVAGSGGGGVGGGGSM